MSTEITNETSSVSARRRGVDVETAVVTGARGIGYEVGRGLARSGRRVVFAVRNPAVGAAAVETIRDENKDAVVTYELLDLADLRSVAAFGARMRASRDRLDVLVNNAGVVMVPERETTADGFELHFGTNHLGHFALAGALLPLLRAAEAPRVTVVGSLAHRWSDLDFDDLQSERSNRKARAYGRSKMANLLFMRELQRRSDEGGWNLTCTGAHPGFARTEAILRPDDSRAKRAFTKTVAGLVPSAESAARPIVYAATSPAVTPAGYYGPGGPGEIAGRPAPAKLAARAQDPERAKKLWEVSEQLTGISFSAVA
jgi:NAD(P)-dependent dehydrogenase (short-subunit alcohol dehydrogenase family)